MIYDCLLRTLNWLREKRRWRPSHQDLEQNHQGTQVQLANLSEMLCHRPSAIYRPVAAISKDKRHTHRYKTTHTQTLTVDLMNSPSNIYHQSQSIKKRKPMLANLVPFPQILRRPMSFLDVIRYVWMLKRGGHVPRAILRWKGCPRHRIPTHSGPSV